MRRVALSVAVMTAAVLCWSGSAAAAGGYALCATGAGKPVVSPQKSGKCAKGQRALLLVSGVQASSLQSQVSSLQAGVSSLQSRVSSLEGEVASLTSQLSALDSLFSGVTRSGSLLTFGGMNVEVNSGAGSTSAPPNGLGNLIIGYNDGASPSTTTGSNNLILGDGESYESYGGIVAGSGNTISGPYASVVGGASNTASGGNSSVSGGGNNAATGHASAVTGGEYNIAAAPWSFIGAGCDNLAGSGTNNTSPCDAGGEALLGGASVTLTGTDTQSP